MEKENNMKSLKELTRPCIWALKPYSSARNEYKGKKASVFLDANENPYNGPYNRYPDPLQEEVKALLSPIKGVAAENIFLGNGSDEAIDLVYRAFCEPRIDNVVAIDPTYGMYSVCAGVNDIEYRGVLLDENYQFKAEDLLSAADSHTKIIWLCSPNNPSGNCLLRTEIEKVLEKFEGLVVLDEAYIDFASEEGFAEQLAKYPNLIILQTFSKAWGSAAIRLGMAFASTEIIGLFNKIKYPYNINELTQKQAIQTLKNKDEIGQLVTSILVERVLLMKAFSELPWCEQVFPTDANFFLAKVTDAQSIYNYLVESGIIVRNRSSISLCNNCLRITTGTAHENETLITTLKKYNA